MNIKISKGESRHLEDCVLALIHSELGNVYFSDEEKAVQAIKEGISKEEIYVAENDKSICLGCVGYVEIGIIPDLYKNGVNECLMMKVLN